MDFYLDRAQQKQLRETLGTIPALVEDLAITITRQARITRPGLGRLKHQKPGSRLPFHIEAASAATELRNCLHGWVNHVTTQRKTPYTGRRDTTTLANWLNRNITILALTPGTETAAKDILERIAYCRTIIDLPPDDEIHIDTKRITSANRQIVTAGQIDKIAAKLGALGDGLNKRRVETLDRAGKLKPCAIDDGTRFYRLGDILDAHHRHTRRNRKTS